MKAYDVRHDVLIYKVMRQKVTNQVHRLLVSPVTRLMCESVRWSIRDQLLTQLDDPLLSCCLQAGNNSAYLPPRKQKS